MMMYRSLGFRACGCCHIDCAISAWLSHISLTQISSTATSKNTSCALSLPQNPASGLFSLPASVSTHHKHAPQVGSSCRFFNLLLRLVCFFGFELPGNADLFPSGFQEFGDSLEAGAFRSRSSCAYVLYPPDTFFAGGACFGRRENLGCRFLGFKRCCLLVATSLLHYL